MANRVRPDRIVSSRPPRTRRELLKLTPLLALGALAHPPSRQSILQAGMRLSDWTSERAFRTGHLAPTFADAEVAPFETFPYNFYDVLEPDVDLTAWTLVVNGLVRRPGRYTIDQLRALPKVTQNTRHVCVEGWDVIGNFGGTRLSDFLDFVGAESSGRYVAVTCADEYYESLDLATARHPQTLLCYDMYGRPLTRGHGAPLRLQIPTTLGYKQAKYLVTLSVVDQLGPQRSFWGDQGYSIHGGI